MFRNLLWMIGICLYSHSVRGIQPSIGLLHPSVSREIPSQVFQTTYSGQINLNRKNNFDPVITTLKKIITSIEKDNLFKDTIADLHVKPLGLRISASATMSLNKIKKLYAFFGTEATMATAETETSLALIALLPIVTLDLNYLNDQILEKKDTLIDDTF
jgi:hypothetical protein